MGLSGLSSSSGAPRNLEVFFDNQKYMLNGQLANESEVNKALKANGITANNGVFKTADGFELTSSSSGIVTNFGGATPLPGVVGASAPIDLMKEKAGWMAEMANGAGALMWAVMSELARVSQRELGDARQLRNAMHTSKIEAKQAQINSTQAQIEAEREAAKEAFITAVVAAVVTAAVSVAGSSLGTDSTTGKALTSSAMALGQVVQKGGDMLSKTSGGQRDADEKKLETKRYERQEAIFDDALDSAKSSYEEAKEQFKLALRIMTEHMERQTQVVQKMTS